MIEVNGQPNQKEVDRLIKAFAASEKSALNAARRAINKTAKYTESQAAKAATTQLKIQQKVIRQRLRTYRRQEGLQQVVWLGLNAFAAKRLGNPRRKGSGVQVGRYFFDGAFAIKRFGSGIYRRAGKNRFPLELQKIQIDEAGELAMRQASKAAEERLLVILRQELNYEFSKLMKNAR